MPQPEPRRDDEGDEDDTLGTRVYRVDDVQAAIALAQDFKRQGRYGWFRGQVQPWPPYSSLHRLRRAQGAQWEAAYLPRLTRFYHWLRSTPHLEALAQDADAMFAVAQHHGIPTNLIDFSTEPAVAGFFSADTRQVVAPGTTSCIYCLDPDDLRRIWDLEQQARADSDDGALPDIRFISIDVPNLWRMEAQAGVFLECAVNWDIVYPMDRIEFPYGGYPAQPPRSAIYPERRSQLELLLDHFFDNESKLSGSIAIRAMVDELRDKGVQAELTQVQAHADYVHAPSMRGELLPEHPSWAARTPWLALTRERHDAVQLLPIELPLQPAADPRALLQQARGLIEAALQGRPDARQHAVQWRLATAAGLPPPLAVEAVATGLDRLWDGMRRSPFSDAQLALSMATWIALCAAGFADAWGQDAQRAVERLFGPSLQVEFRSADGASSRGWVSRDLLLMACRDDLADWLTDQAIERAREPNLLLQICYAPERLFDFQRLLMLFVAQIGPSQLNRSEPYFFHPARLDILGLP